MGIWRLAVLGFEHPVIWNFQALASSLISHGQLHPRHCEAQLMLAFIGEFSASRTCLLTVKLACAGYNFTVEAFCIIFGCGSVGGLTTPCHPCLLRKLLQVVNRHIFLFRSITTPLEPPLYPTFLFICCCRCPNFCQKKQLPVVNRHIFLFRSITTPLEPPLYPTF